MEITSDKEIIVIVIKGLIIDFANGPKNDFIPNIPYHPEKVNLITEEIQTLLLKGVIIKCWRKQGDFLFRIFTCKKKDGNLCTFLI